MGKTKRLKKNKSLVQSNNEYKTRHLGIKKKSKLRVSKNVCRLCEAKDGPFFDIFEDNTLANKMNEILPFAITEDDELPHNICFRCSAKVEELNEFIRKCIISQKNISKTIGKSDPIFIKSKSRKLWEDHLNKSKITNDFICEVVIQKALEGIIVNINHKQSIQSGTISQLTLKDEDNYAAPKLGSKEPTLELTSAETTGNNNSPSADKTNESPNKAVPEPDPTQKPFNIMDHVVTIKVNGVGTLYQCQLCSRNFLQKEILDNHGCVKNKGRLVKRTAKSLVLKPSSVMFINTTQNKTESKINHDTSDEDSSSEVRPYKPGPKSRVRPAEPHRPGPKSRVCPTEPHRPGPKSKVCPAALNRPDPKSGEHPVEPHRPGPKSRVCPTEPHQPGPKSRVCPTEPHRPGPKSRVCPAEPHRPGPKSRVCPAGVYRPGPKSKVDRVIAVTVTEETPVIESNANNVRPASNDVITKNVTGVEKFRPGPKSRVRPALDVSPMVSDESNNEGSSSKRVTRNTPSTSNEVTNVGASSRSVIINRPSTSHDVNNYQNASSSNMGTVNRPSKSNGAYNDGTSFHRVTRNKPSTSNGINNEGTSINTITLKRPHNGEIESVMPPKILRVRPQISQAAVVLSDVSAPYPVGLFQSVPHHSIITPNPAPFYASNARRPSRTVIQTGSSSRLFMSTKPKAVDVEVAIEDDKDFEPLTSSIIQPYTIELDDSDSDESQEYCNNLEDPLVDPTYVLPTGPFAPEVPYSREIDNSSNHICDVCHASFNREQKLLAHIQSHYINMGISAQSGRL